MELRVPSKYRVPNVKRATTRRINSVKHALPKCQGVLIAMFMTEVNATSVTMITVIIQINTTRAASAQINYLVAKSVRLPINVMLSEMEMEESNNFDEIGLRNKYYCA